MKNRFVGFLSVMMFGFISLVAARDTAAVGEGNYLYIVVSGAYAGDGVAYVSRVLYYPGVGNCKLSQGDFYRKAESAFGRYLSVNHPKAFPDGILNRGMKLDRRLHSTYDPIRTVQQAEAVINDWISDEKRRDRHVIQTRFVYRCE